MIVFIDTTETVKNLTIHGTDWEKLGRFLPLNSSTGIIPRIVIEETANHFREEIENIRKEVHKCQLDFGKHCGSVSANVNIAATHLFPEIDVEFLMEQHEKVFNGRMEYLHLRTREYSEVDPATLVQRALSRRKPFDEKGKYGFRDAILWETILNKVKERHDKVVFITRNKKDFGEHGTLAPHLKDDLVAIGCPPDTVIVCEGLDRFVVEYVDPELEKLDSIAEKITEGNHEHIRTDKIIDDLYPQIRQRICEAAFNCDFRQLDHAIWHDFFGPELASLADQPTVDKINVFRLDIDTLCVSLFIEYSGEINCTVDETQFRDAVQKYSEFTGDAKFHVVIGALMNEKTGALSEVGIDSTEIELTGQKWPQ
jgi:hypothetical protein